MTFLIFALSIALVQGAVFPKCVHGSKVKYMSEMQPQVTMIDKPDILPPNDNEPVLLEKGNLNLKHSEGKVEDNAKDVNATKNNQQNNSTNVQHVEDPSAVGGVTFFEYSFAGKVQAGKVQAGEGQAEEGQLGEGSQFLKIPTLRNTRQFYRFDVALRTFPKADIEILTENYSYDLDDLQIENVVDSGSLTFHKIVSSMSIYP